ncbi:MAG: DUF1003 domain-containing protein [Saprospiraceae bacterium]|nr:DUF1003 domain-containing protein [Saprospiraceae bacterium]
MKKRNRLKSDYEELLKNNDQIVQQLHNMVLQNYEDEKFIADKLKDPDDPLSFGERLSDKVAQFGGSWRFIILFGCILLGWIVLNSFILINKPFDPYPYILLNLILSCVAALQAPVIMMSQNRQEEKDRRRSLNDYAVNLKAEIEVRNLHQKIDVLIFEEMKSLLDLQVRQMEILEDLQKRVSFLEHKK